MLSMRRWLRVLWGLCLLGSFASSARSDEAPLDPARVHDLTLLVAPDLPCVWPVGMTPHAVIPTHRIASNGYRRDLVVIDEHTGTQWDAPAHFVPPPDSGLPGAGEMGRLTNEKVPAWQFCGEACVIDVTAHVDEALAGSSYLIRPDVVRRWEQAHRPLRAGDVVLFRSDYTDRYYQPFPAGQRFVAAALGGDSPGWPAPTPDTMEYLGDRGVMTLGLDGASMGPLPDLAAATHQAGGRRGMIWIECATNLKSLPETGAFVALLGAKHAGGSGGECRVVAISQPEVAARLIDAAAGRRVVDLSVTLDENYPVTWPGARPGEEASRYMPKVLNAFSPARGPYFAQTHLLDGGVGTHVALPSFSLLPSDADRPTNAPDVSDAIERFERRFGRLGRSAMSAADAPLTEMMGEAHVIDVRSLKGTTSASEWPKSPVITAELLAAHHKNVRPIRAGEVVIFWSGYNDEHWAPLPASPEKDRLLAAPLAGKAEGWPAPSAEAIEFLADHGVRCVATDGPTLGGADPAQARDVYWLAASQGMLAVEFLMQVDKLAEQRAFFLFAPIKLRDSVGGFGRALALLDAK